LNTIVGFDRDVLLSRPRGLDARRSERSAHLEFARQMLMRLPGRSIGVRLEQRVINDSGRDRLAIEASGTDGFRASLLVDRGTCVPIAYMSSRGISGVRRVDLLEYRPFGGVRFPTVLRTSIGGRPFMEERVTSIEVNTPAATRAFAGRR
jgi:hypothetical protein